jgi:O-antigen/teichoic acid export membrane protein
MNQSGPNLSTQADPDSLDSPITTAVGVARNTLFSGAAQLYGLAVSIVTIPILVRGLGTAGYGLYVVVNVLLTYSVVLDFGLTTTLIWAVAQHASGSDQDRLGRIIGTAFTLLALLGLGAGVIIAALAGFAADSVLHVPPGLRSDAHFVLYLAALGIAVNLCLAIFYAVPQGLQRLDLFAKRNIVLGTLTAAAQILAVMLGAGVRWVTAISVVANGFSLLVFVLLSRRLLPRVSFRPRLDRWALRQLTGFGAMKFVSQLSSQLAFQADRLILAALLPISAVTFYSIPLSIAQRLFVVQGAIAGSFFPAASELSKAGEVPRLHRLYLTSLKLVAALVVPAVVLVGGFARPLLEVWLGRSFGETSADILLVLMVAYGLASLTTIPALAMDATGHPQWTAAFALISAVLNISMTLILVRWIGAIGAAWALLLNAAVLVAPFGLLVQRRFLKLSTAKVLTWSFARPLMAGGVLLAYTIILRGIVSGTLATLGAVVAGGLVYLAVTLLIRVWEPRELRVVLGLMRSLRLVQPAP